MPDLTQAQLDYIVTTTNDRGAAFNHPYEYVSAQTVVAPDYDWLNIVAQSLDMTEEHGYSKKGPRGWNDGTVNSAFTKLVDDVLTGVERHM